MPLTVLTHPSSLRHDPGPGHPENAQRLEAALRGARAAGAVIEATGVRAQREHLVAVHTTRWVDRLLASEGQPFDIDGETAGSAESVDAALWAAGAAVDGIHRVMAGQRVLCLVRPPGHHAEAAQGMGFCLFNNVAVAVHEALLLGARRVAVVDVDVHFGNGTQRIFDADPRVLMIDLHEDNLYPAGGDSDERGVGRGLGFSINVPLHKAGNGDYLAILDGLVGPALERFQPEILVVSLGFDAHERDPLGHMKLTSAGYGALLARLAGFADELCGGRLLVVLEGGYDPAAIEASCRAVVEALGRPGVAGATSRARDASWEAALAALDAGLAREGL